MKGQAADRSRFPDPVYKETVLRPLFDEPNIPSCQWFLVIDRAYWW